MEKTQQKDRTIEQAEVISEEPSIAATEEKYKTNRLTEEECKELHKKLVAYVEKEKPYINPDLKMGDLASALDTSSHSLSYLLNQYLNQSYYDFINEYRVTQLHWQNFAASVLVLLFSVHSKRVRESLRMNIFVV